MLLNVFYAVCLVVLVFAVFFLCLFCFSRLFVPKNENGFFSVIAGREGDERLPEKVFAAFIQSNILSLIKKNPVVVIDFGVSEEIRSECESLLSDGELMFCSAGEFADLVERNSGL